MVTDYLTRADYPFENFTWCFSTGEYRTSETCGPPATGTSGADPPEDDGTGLPALPGVEEEPPPPAPEPPPQPPVPSAKIVHKRAVVRERRVALRIACGRELACRGIVKLENLRLPLTDDRRPRGNRVRYGQRRFKIAAGKRATVRIRLTRAGLKRLRAAGRSRSRRARAVRVWGNLELRSNPRRQLSKRLSLRF